MSTQIRNALTIDVEDYFQVENFRPIISFSQWDDHELRVEGNVHKLLEILNEHQARSTFFILGWIAERLSGLIRNIHESGHEIASHGYAHRMITEQSPDEFREDIHKAKSILEAIIGARVIGFRAPTFSITRKTLWALDILAEEGFLYDSSIFPVHHDRYGIPDWNPLIQRVPLSNGSTIVEVPPLTITMFGMNLPFGGGGYFRLAPLRLSQWVIDRRNSEGCPAVLYLHPWEIDARQPRFPLPPLRKFRHYVNIAATEEKLHRLLSKGNFIRLRDILAL